ncbi:hypothetical protein K7X08_008904 [Anisodus acutangulus]|uniref:Cell division cycle protein 123 homolog n=1 Tax=Anisodus acutangulus TaxID=402998 RepID=A0A9Q1RU83_9SOLA|nr:hypothetical protein K7X08_008904 [Anisodus acutangulus]
MIHQLPESFVEYFIDDHGPFLLPLSIDDDDDALPNRIHKPEEEEDFEVSEGLEDESEQPSPPPPFPELETKIKESIKALGGSVFPKLNWSAPKDAAWISPTGNLCCNSFSEVALLLRASDSLVHDLCHVYDSCSDKTVSRPPKFFLALQKWYSSLRPEMEFRCFVRNGILVGVSQCEVTGFYPVLLEKKDELMTTIQGFYNYKDCRKPVWGRPGLKTAVPYDYLDTSPGSGWDVFLRKTDEQLAQQIRSPQAGA